MNLIIIFSVLFLTINLAYSQWPDTGLDIDTIPNVKCLDRMFEEVQANCTTLEKGKYMFQFILIIFFANR